MSLLRRRMMMATIDNKKQEIGVNLFTDWIDGRWIKDGIESGHGGSSVTNFVEVYPNFTYAAEVPVINYGAWRVIYFYDSDKNYVSSFTYDLYSSKVQVVKIPEGVKYVRTSQYTNQKDFLIFYRTS